MIREVPAYKTKKFTTTLISMLHTHGNDVAEYLDLISNVQDKGIETGFN